MRTVDRNKDTALIIIADDRDPQCGNSSHFYSVMIDGVDSSTDADLGEVDFQHGPIGESGRNGLTNEVLLEIVADRLEGFQSGRFACLANANALHCINEALGHLYGRTADRTARGVEGTNQE